MSRVILGTVAVAAAGRALADPNSSTARQDSCANCQFYAPASDGMTGTCTLAGNSVSASGGCGEFTPAGQRASP
jgi:hypothetical protein